MRIDVFGDNTPSEADDRAIFQGLSDLRITTESDIATIGVDDVLSVEVFDETLGRRVAYDEIFFVQFDLTVGGDVRSGIFMGFDQEKSTTSGNFRTWLVRYSGDPLPTLSPGDDIFEQPWLRDIIGLSDIPSSRFAQGRTFDLDDVAGLTLVSGGGAGGGSFELPPIGAPTIPATDAGERITGTGGNDVVDAGAGDDIVKTGDGDDDIEGGDGDDRLWGGPGFDVFVFETLEFGDNTIPLDFRIGSDTLDFTAVEGFLGRISRFDRSAATSS